MRFQKERLLEEENNFPNLEEEYDKRQNLLYELHARLDSLKELEISTPLYWQDVLKAIEDSMPPGSTLNQFTCDNTTILLSGTCLYDKISVKYLRNLKENGYFSDVRMEKLVYGQGGKVDYIIRCTLNKSIMEEGLL